MPLWIRVDENVHITVVGSSYACPAPVPKWLLLLFCYLAQCLTRGQHSPLKRATYKIVTMCLLASHNRHYRLHNSQSILVLLSQLDALQPAVFRLQPNVLFHSLYIGPPHRAGFARCQDSQWLEVQFPLANLVTAFVIRSIIVGSSSSLAL